MEEKHSPLRSPTSYREDDGDKAALHRLIHALEKGGLGRRAGGLDDLQIQILAGYQPFDPARHDIGAWTAGFKRLVPDDASDGQVLRVLECKLPRQYADLLGQARKESEEYEAGWREAVKLFLSRASGSENRLSKLRKLKSLTQQDGEPVRKFAIRVRDELKRIRGREPTPQEWRDEVMVGALDATAMELDRIANQTPGNPSFWEVIKAVEFWERQHAALLNQGDPASAIRRSSSLGATVLFGDPNAARKGPAPVCAWCAQRGHEETTCVREPRCVKCYGPHPERYHDAIASEEARRASLPARALGGASPVDARSRDSRGPRSYASRDPAGHGQQQLLSSPPPPPPRAFARAAQDAAARDGGGRRCYVCGVKGHLKRECPTLRTGKEAPGGMQAQAHVAVIPQTPAPFSPIRDRTLGADRGVAERVRDLEQWRRGLDQTRTRQGDGPTELERATKAVLRGAEKDGVFNPFE